jgi:hypothetical protein
MTATALLNLDEDLPRAARAALNEALAKMSETHDASRQAWIMRHGLDRAHSAMVLEMASR